MPLDGNTVVSAGAAFRALLTYWLDAIVRLTERVYSRKCRLPSVLAVACCSSRSKLARRVPER